MGKFFLYFSVVAALSGCESFGRKKLVSEWKVLENAESLTCGNWPQSPGQLNITKIQILKGDQVGFVSEVMQRNGSKQYYFSEYGGEVSISPKDLQNRSFGKDAFLTGGGFVDNKLQAVIVVNGDKNNSRMEIRSLKDNIIHFSTADNLKTVQSANSFNSSAGVWMLYKSPDHDRSESELLHNIYFIPIDPNAAKVSFENFRGVNFPPQAQLLLPSKGADAFVTWVASETNKKSFTLGAQQLHAKPANVSAMRKIELPLRFALESWTAVTDANGDDIYVAYVDGDSLVGQAVLKVARIRWNDASPLVTWTKETMLTNEHVSLPMWGRSKNDQLYVMLPKWVDEESTIAIYKINDQGIADKKVSGIFEKGVRIMDTFYDPTNEKLVAMMRQKGRLGWDFKLCEFTL